MSTFLRCACTSLLVSISCGVTQLSYTPSAPAPSSVTCNDVTGCEIACIGDNSCDATTFNSQSASYLTITAEGYQVLYNSVVHCPSNGICDIYGGGEQAFRLAFFYAESSSKITITADGGLDALVSVNIYCPKAAQQPSCIIRLRSDSSAFWSSVNRGPIIANSYMYIESADDIEFQCDANVEWGELFETLTTYPNDIFVYPDVAKSVCSMLLGAYSTNDFFGTNTLECIYRDKGTDYNLLANKRCVPWFTASPSSSSDTTDLPSESPTIKPSVSPTKAPTKAPTESSTKAPTESSTKAPTESSKAPTESSTNAPTESSTKAPTESSTKAPTESSSNDPTKDPTKAPTKAPTKDPTKDPIEYPTTTTSSPSQEHIRTPNNTANTRSPDGSPTTVTQATNYTISILFRNCEQEDEKRLCVINKTTISSEINVILVAYFNYTMLSTDIVNNQVIIIVSIKTDKHNSLISDTITNVIENGLHDGYGDDIDVAVKQQTNDKDNPTHLSATDVDWLAIVLSIISGIACCVIIFVGLCFQKNKHEHVQKNQKMVQKELQQNTKVVNNNIPMAIINKDKQMENEEDSIDSLYVNKHDNQEQTTKEDSIDSLYVNKHGNQEQMITVGDTNSLNPFANTNDNVVEEIEGEGENKVVPVYTQEGPNNMDDVIKTLDVRTTNMVIPIEIDDKQTSKGGTIGCV